MASSLVSLEAAGSPEKPGSSVIHLCMSVNRTVSGSVCGNLSVRPIAMSSRLSQPKVSGIIAGFQAFSHDDVARRAGADAAASMVQTGLDALGNVEDAARNAIVAVRNFFRVDLDGFATRKKGHLVFLRRGFVLDFLDVRIAAAHFVPP